MLYFAYGSNLCVEQMRRRCPGALYLRPARLVDHRLSFSGNTETWGGGGCATVAFAPGEVVFGAIFSMTDDCWDQLDHYEGVPWLYERSVRHVVYSEREVVRTTTYVRPADPPTPPSERYVRHILSAYERLGFDPSPLLPYL